MTNFNLETNAAYNFKAPRIAADADKKIEVVFPTQGTATAVVEDGVATVEVERQVTVVDLGQLEASISLAAEIAEHVERGATLVLVVSCGATPYNLTLAGNFKKALVLQGIANKTKQLVFVYDGADFIATCEVPFTHSQAITPAGAATAVTIDGDRNVVDAGTLALDTTLNATIGANVKVGSSLLVKAASGAAAKTITFGTGFSSPTMAGTIDKSKAMSFVFDGTNFVAVAVAVTLN